MSDVDQIKQFRNQLGDFVTDLQTRWLGDKAVGHLKAENQQLLESLNRRLQRFELELAKRIVELEDNTTLLKELDSIAFAETVKDGEERDFAEWHQSPLFYSKSLLERLTGVSDFEWEVRNG